MKKIIYLLIILEFSCQSVSNCKPVFYFKQESKENCAAMTAFIFEDAQTGNVIAQTTTDKLYSINNDSNQSIYIECLNEIPDDDLFELNLINKIRLRIITTYESIEDFEKQAKEYFDTLYFEQPFKDTIYIESMLPRIDFQNNK